MTGMTIFVASIGMAAALVTGALGEVLGREVPLRFRIGVFYLLVVIIISIVTIAERAGGT